jgi:microcompartment protein CcmK/EutM
MQIRLKRACLSAAFGGVLVAAIAGTVLAQNSDPQVGTWKLNLAKSKYSPGPPPKSQTTKIEAVGAGTKVTVDQVAGDGTARHWEFTANYDGKDVTVTGNNPDADMVARTRVNASTIKTVSKKGGKVTTSQTSAVSSDGKTRTVTTSGTNGAGQTVNNVAVYDKQ